MNYYTYSLGINVRHLDTGQTGFVSQKYDSGWIMVKWSDGTQAQYDEFQQVDLLERTTK